MDGLRRVDRAIQTYPRVYFSDFYVDVRAASLVRAFGSRLDENEWIASRIQTVEGRAFSGGLRELLGPIVSVDALLLEGEGEAGVVDTRPWLKGGTVVACYLILLAITLRCILLYSILR